METNALSPDDTVSFLDLMLNLRPIFLFHDMIQLEIPLVLLF